MTQVKNPPEQVDTLRRECLDHTNLSAIAFAFGALYGVWMPATPRAASLESKFLL